MGITELVPLHVLFVFFHFSFFFIIYQGYQQYHGVRLFYFCNLLWTLFSEVAFVLWQTARLETGKVFSQIYVIKKVLIWFMYICFFFFPSLFCTVRAVIGYNCVHQCGVVQSKRVLCGKRVPCKRHRLLRQSGTGISLCACPLVNENWKRFSRLIFVFLALQMCDR